MRTLKSMKPGESGIISDIKVVGPLKRRLMEMGVIKGCSVQIEKVAPLGDPIEVKLRGYSLSLRKIDAENIIVD